MQFLKLSLCQPKGHLSAKNRNKTKYFHAPIIQRDGKSSKRNSAILKIAPELMLHTMFGEGDDFVDGFAELGRGYGIVTPVAIDMQNHALSM
jgi:hypothetical protein